jgi:hypothetical protein
VSLSLFDYPHTKKKERWQASGKHKTNSTTSSFQGLEVLYTSVADPYPDPDL